MGIKISVSHHENKIGTLRWNTKALVYHDEEMIASASISGRYTQQQVEAMWHYERHRFAKIRRG